MTRDKKYYLDTFRVTEPMLDRLIATAMSNGGGYSDLYFEYSTFTEVTLRDGQVNLGGFHEDYGVGIRVLCGDKTGYAFSESTREADMLAAAKAAGVIALSVKDGSAPGHRAGCGVRSNDFYPQKESWRECTNDMFVPMMTEIDRRIREAEPRAVKVLVRLSATESDIMMYNSFRELTCDFRPIYSLVVSATIQNEKGQTVNCNANKSFRQGPECVIGNEALISEMVAKTLKYVDDSFEAKRPKGGQMPVVMGAGASGILLHEAMGHAFEADFIRKGSSIFTGKMGQRVCPEGITIIDDATIGANRGACNYDDEGVAGQKTVMVRDGILESFLHDRISAAHFGVAPTGNGRRECFRNNPIPRMRATYMENGNCNPADIIASVGKGIYVDEFGNGQVKIGEGDFTFYVRNGYLIENGRLTRPVKDINIIGNGPQALTQISMVGNDATIEDSSWTCGKGQSVAVSCGMPTVLVNGLTVGGE
ncbi:MAG: TldD/PmbA family protein [Bacteroidales bacterium]|nr:TldD/PmbA family protein [Bacteroidales bacterium]